MPAITAIAGVPALTRLIDADAMTYIPAPAIKTAAPNAIIPIDAAVNFFPTTEATTIRAPIAATIPNIVTIAGAPAFERAIADCASTANPVLINNTDAPNESIAVLSAFNFAGPILTFRHHCKINHPIT